MKNKIKKYFHYSQNYSFWCFAFLFLTAVGADFIANEQPLFCKINGQAYFPIFREYSNSLGITKRSGELYAYTWSEQKYESVIFSPIPYSVTTMDRANELISPFDNQQVASLRYRHWLGTDHLGRDVAAGIVFGARVAVQVGLLGMGLATLLGIILGSLAGFCGDDSLKISRATFFLQLLAFPIAIFYAFQLRSYQITESIIPVTEVIKSVFIFLLILLIFQLFSFFLKKISRRAAAKIDFPADLFVMRTIEILNAVPRLMLILAMSAVVGKPSIWYIVLFIGLVSWTGIAKFLRSELLRLRGLPYIEAARALGISEWQILRKHALPNALGSVRIALPFGVAAAILTEASLSFLGIGLPAEAVTWGSMLSLSREHTGGWWLALLPGMAIFLTVLLLNQASEKSDSLT